MIRDFSALEDKTSRLPCLETSGNNQAGRSLTSQKNKSVNYEGVLIIPQPDQEGNKLQRPNSGFYSTYSPRSSIQFLARCSNFCKPLKKINSEGCPSNQVSAAAMTSASDEKWRPFDCFFESREQAVVRRGQIRRIG